MQRMYYEIVKYLHLLVHYCRIYSAWSKIYRFIWQRKYKNVKLKTGLSPEKVSRLMSRIEWKPDGLRELFDAVGSPNYVQYCLNQILLGKEQPNTSLDCDDFAIWGLNVINEKYDPLFFTVSWFKGWRANGHAVCLYRSIDNKELYHLGNWGIRGPFASIDEVINDMLMLVDADELLGFSIYEKRMRLINAKKSGGIAPYI